ncbi:hypothetical protein BT96DRAFT_959085 [Gymnopus androsaceus JB14]|uniref:Uncharacterized protein n=1 Tax=Gymnopus androsaceus JB14 TaxID=1447944 RepID=A0A6A4H5D1_9AGAR|nr:hypothetical protein BT96DRAFT_959085 [Gymnopus androsaceus JB14]
MVKYLESAHVGEFENKTSDEVRQDIEQQKLENPNYEDPSLKLPLVEPWCNTWTPTLTYLLRCNTDVTSLLSGTAVKAVIAYTTDYVTKPGLKTHMVFSAIKNVYSKAKADGIYNGDDRSYARKLLVKMTNSLTSKLEIGSPMASLYLLGNPDHYTNFEFKPFYWRGHVEKVRKFWVDLEDPNCDVTMEDPEETVINDYVFRPNELEGVCLYDWVSYSTIVKRSRADFKKDPEGDEETIVNSMSDLSDASGTEIDSDDESSCDSLDLLQKEKNIKHTYEHKSNNTLNFNKQHEHYKTHMVTWNTAQTQLALNFLGGSLPRSDAGDMEYYSCTMLTLFKPWNTGADLKTPNQSWQDAFNDYNFH